jgi:hypothetical protein
MFFIQAREQCAFTWWEWRDFFADALEEFVVIWPRSQSVELASSLLEFGIEDMPISLENID